PPAEERYPVQFLLVHEAQFARHVGREKQRFPGGLMLGQKNGGTVGEVLGTFQLPSYAQDDLGAPHRQPGPAHGQPVAPSQWQWLPQHAGDGVGDDGDDQEELIKAGAKYRHGYSSLSHASTIDARSSAIRVPGGSSPMLRVFWPLPVSTSQGAQPASVAACRSRSESPTAGTACRSIS